MNSIKYYFDSIEYFIGKAIKKTNDEEIIIDCLELDSKSKQNINDIICNGITSRNQSIFVNHLIIRKKDYDSFIQNQTRTIKTNKTIILSSKPINYTRFQCELDTLIKCSDGKEWAAKLILPSIEFYIADTTPLFDEDSVIFENFEAMIFDKCSIRLMDE